MEKKDLTKKEAVDLSGYNRPFVCKECGGLMIFKGVGEYRCEDCDYLDYDDYGKVRCYIEKHSGANLAQIAEKTGVSQKSIMQMLKEARLEVAQDSRAFMKCSICGANIRSGTICIRCEAAYNKGLEERERAVRKLQN